MPRFKAPKRDFMDELTDRAAAADTPVVDRQVPRFRLANGVTGVVHVTSDQSNPVNLYVDTEIDLLESAAPADATYVMPIVLACQCKKRFAPTTDAVFVLPQWLLSDRNFVRKKPSDGHHLLQIDLASFKAQQWRNAWALLFDPPRNERPQQDETSKGSDLQDLARRVLEEN